MGEDEQLVSDAEREQAVVALRAHLVAGRLSLEQFAERVELAYGARDRGGLAHARLDLPDVADDRPGSVQRRRPIRLTVAAFGRLVRRGRLRLRGWTLAAAVFSDLDLDLREAQFESLEVGVTALVAFGNADVYVPEGVEVAVGGLGLFSRRRDWGEDRARADAPLVRVRVLSLFGTADVWRVPPGMYGDYGEITRELESRRPELPP